jgi:hypothetical protein
MATISGFLNKLREEGSAIRKKWDDKDHEGAMADYEEPDAAAAAAGGDGDAGNKKKLSADQKQKIRDGINGDLKPVEQACQDENDDGKTHVMMWVKVK